MTALLVKKENMNKTQEMVYKFKETGVIPVITMNGAEHAEALADALEDGGLPAAEVTFRAAGAPEIIAAMLRKHPDMTVGAGTVLSIQEAQQAIDAGAKFIVSPGLNPRVVEYCRDKGIPMMPGIATATEVEEAMELGLHAVKFFPAGPMGGLTTIKALSAPYRNMQFMPTGGINASNAAEYLAFDHIYAVGGSWVAPAALIQQNQFERIRKNAAEASAIVRQARA